MKDFASLSIRGKLLVLTLAVSTAALLVISLGFAIYQIVDTRREMQQSLMRTADLIAENASATIAFDDVKFARETLTSLHAEPDIVTACLYKGETLFAEYHAREEESCPAALGLGSQFIEDNLEVFQPVLAEGSPIGTVYIRSTLAPLYSRMKRQTVFILLILLLSTGLASLLSLRLQRSLSGPILELAGTAKTVSDRKDYSIRAKHHSQDELGILVTSFNEMLSQIQQRDVELLRGRELLEQRVEERTEELRQRNEELDRTNQDLDDFAYIASHDLKEPLRGIHNYAAFLLEDYEDKLEEEGREQLQTLVRLSKMMEKIIDSLLEYSRVGRSELLASRVDLNEIVREVLDSLAIVLSEAHVEVRLLNTLPTITCDPVRVAEVFRNLISNAAKYNDKPQRIIAIGVSDAGGTPQFFVRDNGIGIPEKHREAVFQIFKRLHARDKYGGGLGAGLTIVKKIIERHNGSIWLESKPGEGTTFYFTLPGEARDS